MIISRCIAILLAVVLAVVAVPAAGACPMESASSDHASAHSNAEPEPCHDPVPDDRTPLAQECQDCFEHCLLHAQAALLPGTRIKITGDSHSSLSYLGGIDPATISTRLFRPPNSVPLAHSHNP